MYYVNYVNSIPPPFFFFTKMILSRIASLGGVFIRIIQATCSVSVLSLAPTVGPSQGPDLVAEWPQHQLFQTHTENHKLNILGLPPTYVSRIPTMLFLFLVLSLVSCPW